MSSDSSLAILGDSARRRITTQLLIPLCPAYCKSFAGFIDHPQSVNKVDGIAPSFGLLNTPHGATVSNARLISYPLQTRVCLASYPHSRRLEHPRTRSQSFQLYKSHPFKAKLCHSHSPQIPRPRFRPHIVLPWFASTTDRACVTPQSKLR